MFPSCQTQYIYTYIHISGVHRPLKPIYGLLGKKPTTLNKYFY